MKKIALIFAFFYLSNLYSQNTNTVISLECVKGILEDDNNITYLKNGINVKNRGTTFKFLSAPIQLNYRGTFVTLTGANGISTTKSIRNIRPYLSVDELIVFVNTCNSTILGGGGGGGSDNTNIYNTNGTLTALRTVANGGFDLQLPELMLKSSGNVGIGTTTPSAKLEVSGRISQIGIGSSTFVGFEAGLNDDLSNNQNTAIGFQALFSNTEGYQNTANGYHALRANTTGYHNTANGFQALFSNTTGFRNSVNGFQALFSNTEGYQNTANGYHALGANTAGYQNTANGFQAILLNTIGFRNTGNGFQALYSTTIGSGNTANGSLALRANTTGSYNTANGFAAGRYILGGSLNTVTDNSIFIGFDTRANASGETNQTVIGYAAQGIGSNTVVLGNDAVTRTALKGNVGIGTTVPTEKLDVDGELRVRTINSGTYNNAVNMESDGTLTTATSDRRLKRDINAIDSTLALEKILQLNPVTFKWKDSFKIDRDTIFINNIKVQLNTIQTNIFGNKDQKRIDKIQEDSLAIDSLIQIELDSLIGLKSLQESNVSIKEQLQNELRDYRRDNRKRKENQERNNIGLIAQDVLQVLPEAVGMADDGFYFLRENNINTLLIGAIKAQDAKIDRLTDALQLQKDINDNQSDVIVDLIARITALEKR